jgi:DNA-binding transcriptional MerR regulator
MQALGLSRNDFGQIMRVCRRVLVNEATSTDDLKHFLVARLQEDLPETAEHIQQFDDEQMEELRHEIEQTAQAGGGSALW